MLTRSKIVALVLLAVGTGTLASATAFADGNDPARPHAVFPMAGDAFKAKVDARLAKARTHMETRAAQLPADQASALRANFEAKVALVDAEVAKAVADGTVTREEAQAVRAAGPHRGGGKHCEKKS